MSGQVADSSKRLPSLFLLVGGLAFIAAALAGHALSFEVIPRWSGGHRLEFVAGAAMLAGSVLFHLGNERIQRLLTSWSNALGLRAGRWLSALALTLLATVLTTVLPREQLFAATAWICWGSLVAACLFLPARMVGWVMISAVALNAFLSVVNSLKVGMTGLPVTMLDLRIAVANPRGLWNALSLPMWTLMIAIAGVAVVSACVVAAGAAAVRSRLRSSSPQQVAVMTLLRCACIVLIGVMSAVHLDRLYRALAGYRGTWEPQGLAAMAATIGVGPYLAYSEHVEALHSGDFFRADVGAEPPTPAEIRAAVLRHVDFSTRPAVASPANPNIVVLLAESTFDPDAAFRLTRKVDSELFAATDLTAAAGLLRVNVVGGGTWVTEFETIVGLDARLFGAAGYYTHSSLSPYVERSLATYLKARGYRTLAVFPHGGEFYNYRNAYESYGFERILDSRDRGRGEGWHGTDVEIADDLQRILGSSPASPFFAYVGLVENHGPHECSDANIETIPIRFADTADFEPNCALHEYLRRLHSTETAVALITGYLKQLQSRSGRPFVLLVFGDHQPFTFTGTHMVRYSFDRFRTELGKDVTFFHLLATDPRRLRCCLKEVPATVLPTLLSAYTASGPDDVYLGINLWLYDHCGDDAVRSEPLFEITRKGAGARYMAPGAEAGRAPSCEKAYEQSLTSYRRAGIVALKPAGS